MIDKQDFYPYMPERSPKAEDYRGVKRIEIVHFPINGVSQNQREAVVRERLNILIEQGVEITEVDIDTDQGDLKGNRFVIGGSLADVCAAKRRGFIIENGGKARIDTSLTTDS